MKNYNEKDKNGNNVINLDKMDKHLKCQLLLAMSYSEFNCNESFGSSDSHTELNRKILKGFNKTLN